MATSQTINGYQFSWGDTVRISITAPQRYYPGESGSICGIRTIDAHDDRRENRELRQQVLYLIEFGDGVSCEIPESFLEEVK